MNASLWTAIPLVLLFLAFLAVNNGEDPYASCVRTIATRSAINRGLMDAYVLKQKENGTRIGAAAELCLTLGPVTLADLSLACTRLAMGMLADLIRLVGTEPSIFALPMGLYHARMMHRNQGSGSVMFLLMIGWMAMVLATFACVRVAKFPDPRHAVNVTAAAATVSSAAPSSSSPPPGVPTQGPGLSAILLDGVHGESSPSWRRDPPPHPPSPCTTPNESIITCPRITKDNRAEVLSSGPGKEGFILLLFYRNDLMGPLTDDSPPLRTRTVSGLRGPGAKELAGCFIVYHAEPFAAKLREAFFVDHDHMRTEGSVVERMFDRATGRRYAPIEEDFSDFNLLSPWRWTHEVMDGRRETIYATAAPVPYPGSGVRELTAAEHRNAITNSTFEHSLTSLVMYYAPWCGQCKKVEPDFERVAAAFSGAISRGRLMVARVDFTTNAIPGIDVRGYPHFIVHSCYPARSYDRPREPLISRPYTGDRSFEGFSRVLRENHALKPDLTDD